MMAIMSTDGYPMQDVVMQWKGSEAVHGVEFMEIPQFTLVQHRTISTVETLATGLSVCNLVNSETRNNMQNSCIHSASENNLS